MALQHGGAAYSCLVRLLYVFHILFFIIGLALIILGSVVHAVYSKRSSFTGDSLTSAAIFIIIVGLVIFVIALLGCIATRKESARGLFIYMVILIIIITIEIAVAIAGYAMRDQITNKIQETIAKDMKENSTHEALDDLQKTFKCCGSEGPDSWNNTIWGGQHKNSVPDSCCKEFSTGCGANYTTHRNTIYDSGCVTALKSWALHYVWAFGGAIIAFAVIELLGLMLSYCVAKSIRAQYTQTA